jgi:signal transduction histidine kinase/CHASE1-domain containing sensor protein
MAVTTGGTIRQVFRSTVLPWLVLAIGVATSFFMFAFIRDSVERVARLRFEREANNANAIIAGRLRSYSDVLYALRALFASEQPVDRLRFHRFVESLDLKQRYPGFVSLNYAALVLAKDKKRFEEAVRRDTSLDPYGYPQFAIKPPGERPEYYVAVYLEPMVGFEFGFGLDLAANPMAADPEKVAEAVRLHRDSGKMTASAQPLRVKREKPSIYLAMRLPVYRQGFSVDTVEQRRLSYLGSVGAAFDVEYLMRSAMNEEMQRYMRLRLYDAGSAVESRITGISRENPLVFDSDQLTGREPHTEASSSAFVHALRAEIAGRIWEFDYSAQKSAIISETDSILPPLTLAGGLLSSFLLFGVLYSLSHSRNRAVELAHAITKDLRESEAGLAEAQQMAHLGNWALEPVTGRMTCSAETWRILGFDSRPEYFTHADFLRRVHQEDRIAVDAALSHSIETGEGREIEHRIHMGERMVRWAHTVTHPARRDHRTVIPGTIMDITQRKLAEEELKHSAGQLQALSRRLVDIQEFERRRFSRELHDLVGQNLTALSINLDILRTQLENGMSEALQMRLADSATLLESTTGAIENVMSELRPPMLDDYGLLPALQWYGNDFARRTGIEVKIEGDERTERLVPEREIALFRITQEALNNVAKHARAHRVDIKLDRFNGHYVMSVADDGIGFESGSGSKARRRPGLGMVTMRERTQAIGGAFEVEAMSGRGTRVTIRIPV